MRQSGQSSLARMQLSLAADLSTLQVEVSLGILQPGSAALLTAVGINYELGMKI